MDPDKLVEFEHYARVWMRLIEKYGGTHHGYFVPGDCPPSAAFSFPGIGEEGIVNALTAWTHSHIGCRRVGETVALVLYEAARLALAAALDVDEVKHQHYSTKVLGHHLTYLPSYGTGESEGEGENWQDSDTDGVPDSRFGSRNIGSEIGAVAGKFIYSLADNARLRAIVRYSSTDADVDGQDFGFPPGPTYGYQVPGNGSYKNTALYGLFSGELELLDGRWKHALTLQGTDVERDGYGGSFTPADARSTSVP